MKPEYQFKVEKLTDKEQILNGLMNSGYIVSCKQKFGHFEISVYGKERVDGNGLKPSDWFEKMDKMPIPDTTFPKPHPNTILTPWITSVTTSPNTATYTVSNTSDMVLREPAVEFSKAATDAIIKTINESVESVGFGTREVME